MDLSGRSFFKGPGILHHSNTFPHKCNFSFSLGLNIELEIPTFGAVTTKSKAMLTLHKSKYINLIFDESHSLLIEKWSNAPLNDDIYKSEMLIKQRVMKENQPKLVLDDITECDYIVVPEIQNWTEDLLAPVFIDIGLDKYALVINEDLFMEVSLEQTVDEIEDHATQHGDQLPFTIKMFKDKEEALDWLLSDEMARTKILNSSVLNN